MYCARSNSEKKYKMYASYKFNKAPLKHILKITFFSVFLCILMLKLSFFLKVNAGTVSVYRVQYSSEMLNALVNGIQTGTLLPTDRFGIQSDLYALVSNCLRFTKIQKTVSPLLSSQIN